MDPFPEKVYHEHKCSFKDRSLPWNLRWTYVKSSCSKRYSGHVRRTAICQWSAVFKEDKEKIHPEEWSWITEISGMNGLKSASNRNLWSYWHTSEGISVVGGLWMLTRVQSNSDAPEVGTSPVLKEIGLQWTCSLWRRAWNYTSSNQQYISLFNLSVSSGINWLFRN